MQKLILVTRRGILLIEKGLLHDYFEIFSKQDERYYFHVEHISEIEAMVRMKQTSGSKKNSENSEFHFGLRGPLLTIPHLFILLAILNASHYWEMDDNGVIRSFGHIF